MTESASHRQRRYLMNRLFEVVCFGGAILGVSLLLFLLYGIARDGLPGLNWNFITSFPSRIPDQAGIKAALAGSVWLIGLTILFAVPIGVAAGIYLEEIAKKSRLTRLIELNIANLAGVPSIIYGLLGLALFVRALAFERSVISGALTLSLLILPMVIITTQEAIRAVPSSLRDGSLALGATHWQTIRRQTLPAATPGIMTGIILSLSRALGETAPLVTIGALTFVAFVPQGPMDGFTALPIQIYNWASRPQEAFHSLAASAIIVLLGIQITLNLIVIFIRKRFGRSLR